MNATVSKNRMGWFIEWQPGGFISAMPDEQTARRCAAAADGLAILKKIIDRATRPMSDGDILLDDVAAARAVIAKAEA